MGCVNSRMAKKQQQARGESSRIRKWRAQSHRRLRHLTEGQNASSYTRIGTTYQRQIRHRQQLNLPSMRAYDQFVSLCTGTVF